MTAKGILNQDVRVRAINGHGKHDDSILDPESRIFPLVDGVATISSLKFAKVTSQHGGWFRLEFSCAGALPYISPRIVLRCNRMKSDAKAETEEELYADDDIGRIPGMGKSYSKRWKELGFHSVRDLAKVDVSAQTRAARLALLEKLRRDRGSLTEDRLNKLLALAHRVVNRHSPAKERLAALSTPAPAGTCEILPAHVKNVPSPILLPEGTDFLTSLPAPDTLSYLSMATTFTTTTPPLLSVSGPSELAASAAAATVCPSTYVDKMINFSACDELLSLDVVSYIN